MSQDQETSYEETEAGRDMSIAEDTRSVYEALTNNSDSPFYGTTDKELFILAVSYGWRNSLRKPIDGSAHGLFNRPTLTDQQRWVIRTVAMAEAQDPFVIRDEVTMYQIVEEYANAGIRDLYSLYNSPTDGFIELSTELVKMGQE